MVLLRVWRSYLSVLNRHPTKTQMVQTGLLMGAGDITSQMVVEGKAWGEINRERALRFSGIGFVFVAPVIRVWYSTMEAVVNPLFLSAARAALAKVAMDQLTFAPLFHGSIISVIGVTQGKKVQEIELKLRNEWADVVKANWMLWPWVQLCNFFFTPLLVRPLVASVTAFFWNIYFSWKANRLKDYSEKEANKED